MGRPIPQAAFRLELRVPTWFASVCGVSCSSGTERQRNPTERHNEKTRQKAGFSGVPEILKALSGTLNGAGTRSRTRELLITSRLL